MTLPVNDARTFKSSIPLELDCGKNIPRFKLSYETFGELNAEASNAILIFHALSGNSHVTRQSRNIDAGRGKAGWWECMVGPGRPIDTAKYFIICSNVLGSCYGSTGPSSLNPRTGKRYCLDFPIITIHDMVRCQARLLDSLHIDTPLAVIGGSMGGMQAIDWALSYPWRTRGIVPISTTPQSSPQSIAFNEVGRRAILADPRWRNGYYYDDGAPPDDGLAIARMIGHITYLSDQSMRQKFGRRVQNGNSLFKHLCSEFEVESYLSYKGSSFTKRFDANSYLYLTKAIDYFDVHSDSRYWHKTKKRETFLERMKALVISFTSDWLFPSYQSKQLVHVFQNLHVPVSYCEIESSYGHDAFLLETEHQGQLLHDFLRNLKAEH